MPLYSSALTAAVAEIAALATHASLHSGVPDASGSTELTGGSPAYARKAVTWSFPYAGAMDIASPVTFDVPAGQSAFIGLWTASVAGTFLGYAPVNGGSLRGCAFAHAVSDDFYAEAHGLVVGDRVVLSPLPGMELPLGAGPLLYYVIATTSTTFQLSTSVAGSPIALTADGPVMWQRAAIDVFSSQGTVVVSTLMFIIGA